MVEEARELDGLINEEYVPSSVERKKAVLMYFFVGIVVALSQEKISPYEFFHLKQALGRWMVFFITMMICIIFIFIPYLWVIPVILFLIFLVIWILFTKQAWEGKFVVGNDKVMLPVFSGLGEWVSSIFELDVEKTE
jgi:phosphatidylserine synthase